MCRHSDDSYHTVVNTDDNYTVTHMHYVDNDYNTVHRHYLILPTVAKMLREKDSIVLLAYPNAASQRFNPLYLRVNRPNNLICRAGNNNYTHNQINCLKNKMCRQLNDSSYFFILFFFISGKGS